MLTVSLGPDIESRLQDIARRTGRSEEDCIRDAVLEFIEDVDDAAIAAGRLADPARLYTAEEVRRELE